MADGDTSKAPIVRIVLLLVALVFVIGMIVYLNRSTGSTEAAPSASALVTSDAAASWEAKLLRGVTSADAAKAEAKPPARTVRDKRRRDDIRERIYALYGRTPPPEQPKKPRQGADLHAPLGSDAGQISPEYVQERIREDFVPLAKECYEAARERDPSLQGKVVMSFVIVGDESVGGIVESADLLDGTTMKEEELSTCLRESMLSMSFVPPKNGGSVSVTYPFVFSPGDGG